MALADLPVDATRQIRQEPPLGHREQRLACGRLQGCEKPSPPILVELARHIVEQQNRHLTVPFLDVAQLRELERKDQGTKLPLRTMVPRQAPSQTLS